MHVSYLRAIDKCNMGRYFEAMRRNLTVRHFWFQVQDADGMQVSRVRVTQMIVHLCPKTIGNENLAGEGDGRR